jgi:hypothetical protein
MSLEELNKEIYKPDASLEEHRHEESKYDPLSEMKENVKEFKEDEKKKWVKEKKELTFEQKRAIKIGAMVLGGILLILLITFLIVKISQSAFNEKKVSISIEGETNVSSNQTNKYKITVKNDNWVSLKNAKISMNYSENFSPQEDGKLVIENQSNSHIDIGKIGAKSQNQFDVTGAFFAPQDFVVYLNATLSYSPSNFNSIFQIKSQLGVNIGDSPITLEVYAPQELSSGNEIEYLISYKNNGDKTFSDMRIKAEYPDNFSFLSSSQETSGGNNLWYIGDLNPGQEAKITVQGSLAGSGGEIKIIKASIGSQGANGTFVTYNQQDASTKLVSPPILITEMSDALNNKINAGDTLNYTINYKNQSQVGYTDSVITFAIDDNGSILDYSRLKMSSNGYFDAGSKTITWRASEIPGLSNLNPGDGGEIRIIVPVLGSIPIKDGSDKNLRLITIAKIDSPSFPTPLGSNKIIESSPLELKLNSKVILSVSGFYNDANISNSGPIPPRVGQETSYTLHFKIMNVSNDISDVVATSSLPSGVKWKNKIYPGSEDIAYSDRTNQLIWKAGDLKNGTGIISPVKEVSFQISITPQTNQIDQLVTLLNSAILTAKDKYTESDIKVETEEKTTQLPEDAMLGGKFSVEE